MKNYLIALVSGLMLLSLAPPLSAQQTIEEIYSASFNVNSRGNASHQIIVQFLPSPYADYLKMVPETLKTLTLAAIQSDYALYGWEVRDVGCEVMGLGAEENLKITVTCEIPNIAMWNENRWIISIGYANPEEHAQYIIAKFNTMQTVLHSFGADAQYIENGELAFVLPEGAEIVNRAEFENFETRRVELGGGSYVETSLYIGEREGKPAVVMKNQTFFTTDNITITPQELAQFESGALIIEYTGVPPLEENYLLYIIVGAMLAVSFIVVMTFRRKK